MFVNHAAGDSNLGKARLAWGAAMPAWVKLLAEACDRTSQREVAARLGKSGPYVSRILRNAYPGDMAEAERLVRAAYGAERVMCPLFGSMALKTCMRNRRRPHPARHEVHHAFDRTCPRCPNNTDKPHEED